MEFEICRKLLFVLSFGWLVLFSKIVLFLFFCGIEWIDILNIFLIWVLVIWICVMLLLKGNIVMIFLILIGFCLILVWMLLLLVIVKLVGWLNVFCLYDIIVLLIKFFKLVFCVCIFFCCLFNVNGI